MLFWLFLSIVIAYAIFDHTIFGFDSRKILAFIILAFLGLSIYQYYSSENSHEVLIRDEKIVVANAGGQGTTTFPLYGANSDSYFIIYPAIHYRIPIQNKCPRFVSTDRNTWCGDAKVKPLCNTPNDSKNCSIVSGV